MREENTNDQRKFLEQLAPLDAQIAALKGSGNEMDAITAHASELAELAVEEDEILRTCGPADRRGSGISGPAPGAPPTLMRLFLPCSPTSLSSAATVSARKTLPFWAASPVFTDCR